MQKKKHGCCGTILWIVLILIAAFAVMGLWDSRSTSSHKRDVPENNSNNTAVHEIKQETSTKKENKKENKREKKKETDAPGENSAEPVSLNVDFSAKETIKAVQSALNDQGYACGTADGISGNKTKEAIKSFKENHDMKLDSEIDNALLNALGITEKMINSLKETEAPKEEPQPVETPKEEPQTAEATKEEPREEPQEVSSGIRPEFKEMVDSYEEFFDEYVAFMKKYEQNPSDVMLLAQYAEFAIKYADYMEKLDTLETDAINDEESYYFAQATLRIDQKLLDVAYQMN